MTDVPPPYSSSPSSSSSGSSSAAESRPTAALDTGPVSAAEALRTLPDNSSRSVTLDGRPLILAKSRGELYL